MWPSASWWIYCLAESRNCKLQWFGPSSTCCKRSSSLIWQLAAVCRFLTFFLARSHFFCNDTSVSNVSHIGFDFWRQCDFFLARQALTFCLLSPLTKACRPRLALQQTLLCLAGLAKLQESGWVVDCEKYVFNFGHSGCWKVNKLLSGTAAVPVSKMFRFLQLQLLKPVAQLSDTVWQPQAHQKTQHNLTDPAVTSATASVRICKKSFFETCLTTTLNYMYFTTTFSALSKKWLNFAAAKTFGKTWI